MIRLSRQRPLLWVVTLVVTSFCATALAGNTQQDAARAAARSAGYEGIQAYENGDLRVAVDKLERAFDVVKVPTLGLWYARALAKTGNLVEASERYGEVIRLDVTEGKVKEQKQAQADAATELEALKPKIPTLTLTIPIGSDDCQVTLDGVAMPMKLLALATPINPGTHRIQASQGSDTLEESFTIAVGEKKAIALKFKSANAASPTGTPRTGTPNAGTRSAAADSNGRSMSSAKSPGSTQKTIGWISLGVGGVATVAGAVTGMLVLSKRSQLDDSNQCKGTVCTSDARDSLDSYNQMRTMSSIGFVVGAVGVGVGTTLLLTTPKPKDAGVSAWLGLGSVGVTGRF